MKIIFLDFDGVMTTLNYVEDLCHQGKKHSDYFGAIFKQDSVESLKDIIDNTGASIVITSDWRNHFGLIGLKIMWLYRKMPGKIYGILPKGYKSRTTLIEEWLFKHKNVTTYVIIDDLPENQFMPEQRDFLVSINPYDGLNHEMSQKAIKHLKRL